MVLNLKAILLENADQKVDVNKIFDVVILDDFPDCIAYNFIIYTTE